MYSTTRPSTLELQHAPWTLRCIVLAILLLVLTPLLAAAGQTASGQSENTWMTVLLDGRKIGHAHFTRKLDKQRVTTVQSMKITLQRAGIGTSIGNSVSHVENANGQPLSFSSSTHMSGIDSTLTGTRLADGRFQVTRSVAGQQNRTIIRQPKDALLSEGQRLASMHAGLKPGTRYSFQAWDVDSGKRLETDNIVTRHAPVMLPDGPQQLTLISQTTHFPAGKIDTRIWLNNAYQVRKIHTQMLGMSLEMLACDKTCAMAPNQNSDILRQAMVTVPEQLGSRQLGRSITYTMDSLDDQPLHFASTDEQQVRQDSKGRWLVSVGYQRQHNEPAPQAADTEPNDWLQSDNPDLRKLARQAVGTRASDAQRMQALQHFVSGYIDNKSLNVGYASALEVMHNRQGDCTEHAVLLAALARAENIPTRVVTGLVYADQYAGRQHVLVPHAWVQSWVDGHWHSYDAALGGFNSGHVTLAIGNGEPWQFFAGINTLGRIRVDRIKSVSHSDSQG